MRISIAIFGALCLTACGGSRAQSGSFAQGEAQTPTRLTPTSPPLCGDFGRPYLAPESQGQTNPAPPPQNAGVLDERLSRIVSEGDGLKDYLFDDVGLILNGRTRVGLDERSLYLANGLPAFYWNTQIEDDSCRVLLYGMLREDNIDTVIYSCNNVITHIGPVSPRIPCWRLEEVAPRAIEGARHFDRADVQRQWEILYGLLRRGHSQRDVGISFGPPFRTGLEAREDGTTANEAVYLDSTGDAYATYLTFVDESLRGWRFPAERVLTPQAEQRRLDAMEGRMRDQMRDMERASIARHQAEVAHLNRIQENQEEIRNDIAGARDAIMEGVSTEAQRTRGVVRSEGEHTREEVRELQRANAARAAELARRNSAAQRNNSGSGGSEPRRRQTQGSTPPGQPSGSGQPSGQPSGQQPAQPSQPAPPARVEGPCTTGEHNGVIFSDSQDSPVGQMCGAVGDGCAGRQLRDYVCMYFENSEMPVGICVPRGNPDRCDMVGRREERMRESERAREEFNNSQR